MVKTIAATTATNFQKTVQFVNQTPTSSARTIVASRNSGLVTLLMIVEMVPTNRKRSAKANTENVLSLSSIATTESVSQADGDVVSWEASSLLRHD
jgi:hypothetical protein